MQLRYNYNYYRASKVYWKTKGRWTGDRGIFLHRIFAPLKESSRRRHHNSIHVYFWSAKVWLMPGNSYEGRHFGFTYACRALGSWVDAKSKLTITWLVSFVWTQRNYWTVTCEGSGHWEFSAVLEFARCRVNEAYKKRPKKIRQRWCQWKRSWNIDFASFQFFFAFILSHPVT